MIDFDSIPYGGMKRDVYSTLHLAEVIHVNVDDDGKVIGTCTIRLIDAFLEHSNVIYSLSLGKKNGISGSPLQKGDIVIIGYQLDHQPLILARYDISRIKLAEGSFVTQVPSGARFDIGNDGSIGVRATKPLLPGETPPISVPPISEPLVSTTRIVNTPVAEIWLGENKDDENRVIIQTDSKAKIVITKSGDISIDAGRGSIYLSAEEDVFIKGKNIRLIADEKVVLDDGGIGKGVARQEDMIEIPVGAIQVTTPGGPGSNTNVVYGKIRDASKKVEA